MNVMKDIGSKTKYLALITMGLLIASCSDNELSFPEDMHTNERAITDTVEFDLDPSATLPPDAIVF